MNPETTTRPYGVAPPAFQLPDATTLGPVHLQVSDLARSLDYYQRVIGLRAEETADGNGRPNGTRRRSGAGRPPHPAWRHTSAARRVRPLSLRTAATRSGCPWPFCFRPGQAADSGRHGGSPRERGLVPLGPRWAGYRDLRRSTARDMATSGS